MFQTPFKLILDSEQNDENVFYTECIDFTIIFFIFV